MSWLTRHRLSEQLAAEAESALRLGDRAAALALYRQAALQENAALDELDKTKTRTLGISAVSAVSLSYKGGDFAEAEKTALRWFASGSLPTFAADEMRGLLQAIWSERVRQRSGAQFAPGEVIVSVKGGEIIEGGAPLDLIVERVQVVQALFYRTAEFLRNLPHRKKGPPSKEIQDSCRPWLFQTAPGSYQFAVAVQERRQPDMFTADLPPPKEVADHFLQILRAGIESPDEQLMTIVPNDDYRETFLKLTRNLAPSGKVFDQLEVKAADQQAGIRLGPETRKSVNASLRKYRRIEEPFLKPETMTGVLRAIHLDSDWLEITVDGRHMRVVEVGEAVDDLIGPLVNKRVIVQVLVDATGQRRFVDIEPEE